jgi:hypothetical protein
MNRPRGVAISTAGPRDLAEMLARGGGAIVSTAAGKLRHYRTLCRHPQRPAIKFQGEFATAAAQGRIYPPTDLGRSAEL